jgi:hypothetical protein
MKATSLLEVCLFFCLGLSVNSNADYQIFEPGYTSEVYVNYAGAPWEASRMTIDSEDNLYITHTNAQVNKIAPDKTVTLNWSAGFNTPWSIQNASGTKYGNKLYITERNVGISSINFDGSSSPFSTLSGSTGLSIDKKGNYGGDMFAGTSGDDRIYRVSTSGQKTTFCSYFSGMSGGIAGIAFDPASKYGGTMYTTTWSPTDPRSGIYSVNPQGQTARFCSNIVWGSDIQFDVPGGLFGGDMFVTGKFDAADTLQLYRIGTNGVATPFIRCDGEINGFTFGNDGALYFHEFYQGTTNIIRVVPEPATLLLFGLGLLGMRCRKG